MSKTARKSAISRALSVVRKGYADGGSPKEVLGEAIRSVVPDLSPGQSRMMPDARLLARLYRGEGMPTPASRAGLTEDEAVRREGTLSAPVRPGGDTVEQRIASGVARAPRDIVEASGIGQAARSAHDAYADPSKENLGRAALDAALSVPGMGMLGRGVEAVSGPVGRAMARAGELLPETAAGKAALGVGSLGGATLAGTASAGPLEEFTGEYLKINPFPRELSREEFIKARRDAAEAPHLSGRRPDPNEAARLGNNAAKKAAKEYEDEVKSLASRREKWQKDFDKAWETKQRQEKEMGQRPFHERYPDYSAYALPVALAGSAILPAAGQAMVRGFETSPVRNAARALDSAVARANQSRSGAYAGVGTGEAALDNATALKALEAYEAAVQPANRSFGSKAAGVAGDIAATGTGAALPSLSVQLPYLVDYSQPEGSRAKAEASKQFTPEKLLERMLGPGAAGVGVAGLSRSFGNQASKLAINPGPTKDNLYRAQALKDNGEPSEFGARLRSGLKEDGRTREFLRDVAPASVAPQEGLLRRLFGTRPQEGVVGSAPTALPAKAPPPLLGSDVPSNPAVDRALEIATKPPEAMKAIPAPPPAVLSNPPTSKSPSGLPDWAGEPPKEVRLRAGYYWDRNLQQPRHKDGSFGEMPKFSRPKATPKATNEPLTPETIPNKPPKSPEELFDPNTSTGRGLKGGGFVKSAMDTARQYADGGDVLLPRRSDAMVDHWLMTRDQPSMRTAEPRTFADKASDAISSGLDFMGVDGRTAADYGHRGAGLVGTPLWPGVVAHDASSFAGEGIRDGRPSKVAAAGVYAALSAALPAVARRMMRMPSFEAINDARMAKQLNGVEGGWKPSAFDRKFRHMSTHESRMLQKEQQMADRFGEVRPVSDVAGYIRHPGFEPEAMNKAGGVNQMNSNTPLPQERLRMLYPNFAEGGAVALARQYANGGSVDSHVHSGPIVGHDGGRADTKPITVPAGAYIIPADVVSAFGGAGGNTLAGMKALEQAFGRSDPSRASGGAVPIKISDGEFVVAPDQVARVGGGDVETGHRNLDDFVRRIRADHIKTLSSLPGPAQS